MDIVKSIARRTGRSTFFKCLPALAGELSISLFEFMQVLFQAFEKEGAFYGGCQLICEDLHDGYVIRGKCLWLIAMYIEYTDQVAFHFEGQCHLGTRLGEQ